MDIEERTGHPLYINRPSKLRQNDPSASHARRKEISGIGLDVFESSSGARSDGNHEVVGTWLEDSEQQFPLLIVELISKVPGPVI